MCNICIRNNYICKSRFPCMCKMQTTPYWSEMRKIFILHLDFIIEPNRLKFKTLNLLIDGFIIIIIIDKLDYWSKDVNLHGRLHKVICLLPLFYRAHLQSIKSLMLLNCNRLCTVPCKLESSIGAIPIHRLSMI